MESTRSRLAAEVRAEMGRRRVSLSDLAHRTGIPLSTLRRRIVGVNDFSLRELDLIADALGADVVDLIERSRETAVA